MPGEQTSHLGYINEKTLEEVRSSFLEPNTVDGVYFTTINIANDGFGELVDTVGLDPSVLSEGPVGLVMEHGNGYFVRGPRTATALAEYVNELDSNRQQGW